MKLAIIGGRFESGGTARILLIVQKFLEVDS